jgi:hypothetical protein
MPKRKRAAKDAADSARPVPFQRPTAHAFLAGKFVQPHLISHLFAEPHDEKYPKILDEFVPTAELRARYDRWLVDFGTQLEVPVTKAAPLLYSDAPAGLYSFFLLDVDAPSPYTPTDRSYVQWFAMNVVVEHNAPSSASTTAAAPAAATASGSAGAAASTATTPSSSAKKAASSTTGTGSAQKRAKTTPSGGRGGSAADAEGEAATGANDAEGNEAADEAEEEEEEEQEDMAMLDLSSGNIVVKYLAPNPMKSNHRFVFLLCRQRGKEAVPDETPNRKGFDLRVYITEHQLEPVAINFFCLHANEFASFGKKR